MAQRLDDGAFASLHLASLGASDVQSRFFGAGPTDIFQILASIDDRIGDLNAQALDDEQPCLAQAPVPYTLNALGASVPFQAQCYERIGDGFVQFGRAGGVTYYFAAVGASWVAATLTPYDAGSADGGTADAGAGPASGTYTVHAWVGVGYDNATSCGNRNGFDDCSYGVIELVADPRAHTFEMAVAGIGFGYCGAQLASDGATVYATGSIDMATSCLPADTFCVAASDLRTAATCGDALTKFSLAPLGRTSSVGPNSGGPGHSGEPGASWAPSEYPGGAANSVILDGTPTDSLHFGPTAPTPGVGVFGASNGGGTTKKK